MKQPNKHIKFMLDYEEWLELEEQAKAQRRSVLSYCYNAVLDRVKKDKANAKRKLDNL
jgi:hypothetical protein